MHGRSAQAITVLRYLATVSVAALTLCLVRALPARAEFGISAFDQQISANATGDSFSQAGGHPYAITTEIELNHHEDTVYPAQIPDVDAKDIVTNLPAGLFGNPTIVAQCTTDQLAGGKVDTTVRTPECPIGSQVGIIEVRNAFAELLGVPGLTEPLYNMTPPVDQPARFGFNVLGEVITLSGNVRNGGDFGVTVTSTNVPDALPVTGITITFWGVPADPSHDFQRCNSQGLSPEAPHSCRGAYPSEPLGGANADPEPPKAFLTMPVSCTASGSGLATNLQVDSWSDPGKFAEATIFSHALPGYPAEPEEWGSQVGVTGCGLVPFKPSISVEPTTHQADTPTGLAIDFSLPQDGLLSPEGIATADVEKTVFSLPPGISVSPSAADGLGACSLAQIGLDNGEHAACPDSSKLGTVEIDTPLLPEPLHGAIYLGRQGENPFHNLITLYLVAEGHGVTLKLPGEVNLDARTGQLVSTFDKSPQLPFNDLKIDLKGGPRSPLVNPHECGDYTADAVLTPWSGSAPVSISDSFSVTSGPGGAPCPSPRQFSPSFAIGTTSNQAGGFSLMTLTMTRADGDEQLGAVAIETPSGLLGTLKSVALCPEPQATLGTCGAESQIGTVTAGAGAGPNPFYVQGGRVYLTGPYRGAPFGLSVVVPAVAGPFDLGMVVVRGTVAVDPHTAALSVSTDPLPTILQGIPLDLRLVNVNIDRPGFIFNPTNCEPLSIGGSLTGGLGDVEPVSSRFQVTNCRALGFTPKFSVSTSGKTSRARGASLVARLTYPAGSMGKQSNIAKVKVSLPKQLPSRLTTLQKACPAETFQANPAMCPAASKIGSAKAMTPVLPVSLSGPVYFVSHGGEAFPDLVIVLQGYGVTVDLVGTTFINKAGITSTTFEQVPDVPIDSFELKLPQGPNSALAANGNLCAVRLAMPAAFVAQDGAVIHQSTPVTATGCAKHKARKAKKRKR
jgi:hypothetical protein